MLLLTAPDLARALPLAEAIAAMEEAFRLADGEIETPVRIQVSLAARDGTFLVMPALGESLEIFGAKIASVIPGNASSGLGREIEL